MKKILLMILITFIISLISLSVIAIDQGRLPNSFRYVQGIDVSQSPALLNIVVGGGACANTPTDAGCVRELPSSDSCNSYNLVQDHNSQIICSGEGVKGCRICFYDSRYVGRSWSIGYDSGGCKSLLKDQRVYAPAEAYYFERYDCVEDACMNYEAPKSVGCGIGTCEETEMLRRFTDGCNNIYEECTPWTTCREESCQEHFKDIGSCIGGLQKQVLIRTDCSEGYSKEVTCEGGIITTTSGGDPKPIIEENQGIVLVARDPSKEIKDVTLIKSDVFLKNTGTSMNVPYIIEMQVRPRGALPLSVIGAQETCDPEHPENVHRTFQLANGEEKLLTLVTGKEMTAGWYTVYLLTRTKCFKDLNSVEIANIDRYWRVNPYPNTLNLGNICIGDKCYEEGGTGGINILNYFYLIFLVVAVIVMFVFIFKKKKRRRKR